VPTIWSPGYHRVRFFAACSATPGAEPNMANDDITDGIFQEDPPALLGR
jgi:hypothetical protein